MKMIILALTMLCSGYSIAAAPATGQITTDKCDCPTCLAKGNCVFTDPNGNRISVPIKRELQSIKKTKGARKAKAVGA